MTLADDVLALQAATVTLQFQVTTLQAADVSLGAVDAVLQTRTSALETSNALLSSNLASGFAAGATALGLTTTIAHRAFRSTMDKK